MNKYIRNMIAIALIVAIILLLFSFWINVDFGVWHMLLIITGGYGLYLNFKAFLKKAED